MNKNNNLGRFILVLVIIAWALMEIYPPTSRDLVKEFSRRAQNQDATFKSIVERTTALRQAALATGSCRRRNASGTSSGFTDLLWLMESLASPFTAAGDEPCVSCPTVPGP